jgi:BirA family biotin operon repressor/biotin-[acetyl-CoA-carboxylase] ligase
MNIDLTSLLGALVISDLSADLIRQALRTDTFGRELLALDACNSTNGVAEQFALTGAPDGLAVVAATQTNGRGRFGREWVSPRGGLWMTILIRKPELTSTAGALPLIGALSAARALNSDFDMKAQVRWPNDVVVKSSKIAGVLAESRFKGNEIDFALLGIGINVNFPSMLITETRSKATTVLTEVGREVDLNELAARVLNESERLTNLALSNQTDHIVDLLRSSDYSSGKRVRISTRNRIVEGIFSDYRSLTSVEVNSNGEYVIVESATAESVEYV